MSWMQKYYNIWTKNQNISYVQWNIFQINNLDSTFHFTGYLFHVCYCNCIHPSSQQWMDGWPSRSFFFSFCNLGSHRIGCQDDEKQIFSNSYTSFRNKIKKIRRVKRPINSSTSYNFQIRRKRTRFLGASANLIQNLIKAYFWLCELRTRLPI